MSRDTEFVKKVLLNMKYDSTKTLSENKTLLNEASTISWVADRDYDLETTGFNYTLYKGATFKGVPDNTWVPKGYGSNYDSYYSKCPGPDCIAKSTAYSYMGYVRNLLFTCKPDTCEIYDVTSMAIFDACLVNETLLSKLRAKFCRNAEEIELNAKETFIELTPDLLAQYKVDPGKLKTDKAKSQEQPKKTQDEINKEILARKDASQVAPRLYASSLGYKDWASYQKQFCCPTYAENPAENAKCNENIGLAFEQGWKPGDGVPEGMKSSYCKGEETPTPSDEVVIDDGTGQGIEGEGEGTYLDLSNGGKEGLFVSKQDPYFKDLNPEETIWDAEFVGGETKLNTWFEENFLYPKQALKKKQSGVCEITFIVNTDGTLSDFTILRGSGVTILDDYALELVKKMPNWEPATKDGVKIQSKITMPIEFNLP
jgi:TonB family protein